MKKRILILLFLALLVVAASGNSLRESGVSQTSTAGLGSSGAEETQKQGLREDSAFRSEKIERLEPDTEETFPLAEAVTLEMEQIDQLPELPTGCEVTSLTMLLRYYGFTEAQKTEIADEYLVYSDNFVIGFSGDPYSESGGGCYAPGMVATADRFLESQGSDLQAENLTGSKREDLYEYVARGTPVLVWNTIDLSDGRPSGSFCTYEGKQYEWNYREHCVVLSGYDRTRNVVQIHDPLAGIVERDADRFWKLYEDMGSMAIVLKREGAN